MVERAADAGDGELSDAAWRSVAVRIGRAPRRRGERPPGPQRRARDIAEAVGLCVPAEAGTQGTYESRVTLRRSEEHTSELQTLMRNSYAVFCLKKQNHQ